MQLLQSLVGSTQSRSVRHSSTKNTYHHRNIYPPLQSVIDNQGHCNIQRDDTHGQHVQPDSSFFERREEGRTDLQAYTKHKQNQSEILQEGKNGLISCKSEVSGKDSHKKDEGNAQGDAEDFDFSQ